MARAQPRGRQQIVEAPGLRVEDTGHSYQLAAEVSTVGRGAGVDVPLSDPSVSPLHAELVRRGPYLYVADLGLSHHGTRVNGRPVGRRLLAAGDVVAFGSVRTRITGLSLPTTEEDVIARPPIGTPELTKREMEVLDSLCRPALGQDAFVAPATAKGIAGELVVTEAAVKQHLLRLYHKFGIGEGANRRTRLANEVISAGVVRPMGGVVPFAAPFRSP